VEADQQVAAGRTNLKGSPGVRLNHPCSLWEVTQLTVATLRQAQVWSLLDDASTKRLLTCHAII
jgi:hypothetical protein